MFAFLPSFLMSGMLLALAGVSIPVIIHLLHRQRTQPIQWGAMQFLLESPLQQKRRKTVEHWLLMLLRMLLIALVVFLLARPLAVSGKYNPLGSNLATDIGIVVDHSLSTGRRTGDRTVLERNVADIEELTKPGVLRGNDTISIVLAEHKPRALTPLPVNPGHFPDELTKLRRLKPGLTDAPLRLAVQEARDLITRKGRNTRKVIIVVSDAQRTGWDINSISSWDGALGQRIKGVEPPVKMYELSNLPDPQAPNVSVSTITVSPNLVSVGRPAQIDATLINNGAQRVPAMTATMKVGGRQVTRQPVAELEAKQSRTVHFEHAFTDAGSNSVEVSIDADDSLAADNSAVVSVYAWQTLPVLIIDGKLAGSGSATAVGPDLASQVASFNAFRNSRFLQMAMLSDASSTDAVSVIKPTVVGSLDSKIAAHLDEYAAVVVNDVPRLVPELQAKLADYVRSGHGVWFILGERTDPVFIHDSLAQAHLFQTAENPQPRQDPGDRSVLLSIKDPENPMLKGLTAAEHNLVTGVKTFKWWSLKPLDQGRKVLLTVASTGDPLIIDLPLGSNSNGGCVVVWATSVDGGAWNDWPGEKLFAPLVNEAVYHLAGGQIKGMENRTIESGDPITWTGPAKPIVQKIEITRPDGTKVEQRPTFKDGRQVLQYENTDLPGKYELQFDQTAIQPVFYGVSINPSELDEAALNDSDRAWLMHPDHKYLEERIDAKSLGTALGNANAGTELWPRLAGLVLVSLLVETFMTFRMVRRQAGPAPDAVLAGSVMPVRI